MRGITTKIFLRLILLNIFFFVSSCGVDMSIKEGESWFAENKSEVMNANRLLLEHPDIQWVDPELGIDFVPKRRNFTRETASVYEVLEDICRSLGIKSIAISRDASSGELISICYVLSSSGLAVSGGRSLSVEYISDGDLLEKLRSTERIINPLDLEDWYLVDYQEKEKGKGVSQEKEKGAANEF